MRRRSMTLGRPSYTWHPATMTVQLSPAGGTRSAAAAITTASTAASVSPAAMTMFPSRRSHRGSRPILPGSSSHAAQ